MKTRLVLESEDYQIEKVENINIFNINFSDNYNMGMTFLRYQEFYESPQFANKSFTILEFMDWYSKKFGKGSFTYCNDWGGFNIPSNKIFECMENIPDMNHYDLEMKEIVFFIKNFLIKNKLNEKFYLLGSCNNEQTLKHEIAHGLYYLNDDYKNQMDSLKATIDKDIITQFSMNLLDYGYTENVIDDEIQAYFSTGISKIFKLKGLTKKVLNNYVKIYNQYTS